MPSLFSYPTPSYLLLSKEKEREKRKLVIKPNPASDFVTIEIETTETLEDFEIELVGLLGQKLMTYQHGKLIDQLSTIIHLDQYPSGVYILLLKSKNRVHFEKIVVTR